MNYVTATPSISSFLSWLAAPIVKKRRNKKISAAADETIARIEAMTNNLSYYEGPYQEDSIGSFQQRWDQAQHQLFSGPEMNANSPKVADREVAESLLAQSPPLETEEDGLRYWRIVRNFEEDTRGTTETSESRGQPHDRTSTRAQFGEYPATTLTLLRLLRAQVPTSLVAVKLITIGGRQQFIGIASPDEFSRIRTFSDQEDKETLFRINIDLLKKILGSDTAYDSMMQSEEFHECVTLLANLVSESDYESHIEAIYSATTSGKTHISFTYSRERSPLIRYSPSRWYQPGLLHDFLTPSSMQPLNWWYDRFEEKLIFPELPRLQPPSGESSSDTISFDPGEKQSSDE